MANSPGGHLYAAATDVTQPGARLQRAIGGVYSWAADKLYEPVVVRTAFPVLGGDLESAVLEQARRAVELAAGRPILDVPVGTAHFTTRAAVIHNGIVVGSDFAEGMVRESKRAARAAGVEGLVLVQADVHALPFANGSFAAILCTNGLQVFPGMQPAVNELARVLTPGGRLYVAVITLPIGMLLPPGLAAHLPTLLNSKREVIDALIAAGLSITSVTSQRLATFIEALKPAFVS